MLEGRILICKAKSILHPHSGWFCVSRASRAQQAKASNLSLDYRTISQVVKCTAAMNLNLACLDYRTISQVVKLALQTLPIRACLDYRTISQVVKSLWQIMYRS